MSYRCDTYAKVMVSIFRNNNNLRRVSFEIYYTTTFGSPIKKP